MPRKKGADPKMKTSIQISEEGKRLLELLSKRLGVSQSAIMELAIREKAKREKVE